MRFGGLAELVRRSHRRRVFERIWRANTWGSRESRSGPGSELVRTERFRAAPAAFLEKVRPGVLLDAPCGDYNWMRHVPLPEGCRYVGIDIVGPMVRDLDARWGSPTVSFVHGDILSDPLPPADVWLCRESLFHMPLADAARVLERWRLSGIPWFLATTSPDVPANHDVETGGWRPLNLELEPFCLGEPMARLPDGSRSAPGKVVGVWRHATARPEAPSRRNQLDGSRAAPD